MKAEWESDGKGIKRDNTEALSSYSGERRGEEKDGGTE